MPQLLWHSAAIQEAREAYEWFRSEARPGVASAFQKELDAAVDAIQVAPSRWPLVRDPNLHRKRLRRPFRYSIIYRVQQDDVLVLAVMHQSRRPGYWAART